MIVKDEETLEEALQVLAALPEGVRYSDQYSYIIITNPAILEAQCLRALMRNDIAVVVSRGQEHEMEDYTQNLYKVREVRAKEEKKKIKEWIREHPEVVEKIKKESKLRG